MRTIFNLVPKREARPRPIDVALLALWLAGGAMWMQAQSRPTEYQVKAAYLYNFGKFVNWKDTGRPQFDLCIIGNDPFGSDLDSLVANATIGGKKIAVRRLTRLQDAEGCEIAFISQSEAGHLDRDTAALSKLGALTVSDVQDFLRHGGMIQFVEEDRRVRFEVNLKAVQDAGLTVSSELLKVALKVQK